MLSEEWSSPRAHALVAAWTSVVIGCVITALSFYTAQQLKSMSLYALSIMSAIDTASSVLVIVFWRECRSEESATLSQHKTEQKYTLSVGVMMIIMGVMLLGDR
jgi:divalent metal cation (Fe/Co/Zn/Cd) transporter